jgi:hypothetical protein
MLPRCVCSTQELGPEIEQRMRAEIRQDRCRPARVDLATSASFLVSQIHIGLEIPLVADSRQLAVQQKFFSRIKRGVAEVRDARPAVESRAAPLF